MIAGVGLKSELKSEIVLDLSHRRLLKLEAFPTSPLPRSSFCLSNATLTKALFAAEIPSHLRRYFMKQNLKQQLFA